MAGSSRTRGIALKGVAYCAVFAAVFLVSLWRFFPYAQLARNLEARLRAEGLSARIQDLGPGLFAGLRAKRVSVSPTDGSWRQIDLDDVQVQLPLGRWVRGERSVDFGARAFGGRVQASYLPRSSRPAIRGLWQEIDLGEVRLPAPLDGVPLSGTVSGTVDAQFAQGRLNEVSGQLDSSLARVSIGGGRVFGIKVPGVTMGDGRVRVSSEEGKVEVEAVTFEGGDLGVEFKGSVLLREDLPRSLINGVLALRPNEKVGEELAVLFALFPTGKASDGRYTARVRGSLDSPRLLKR